MFFAQTLIEGGDKEYLSCALNFKTFGNILVKSYGLICYSLRPKMILLDKMFWLIKVENSILKNPFWIVSRVWCIAIAIVLKELSFE